WARTRRRWENSAKRSRSTPHSPEPIGVPGRSSWSMAGCRKPKCFSVGPRPKIRAKPPLTSSSQNAISKSRSRKLPKPNIAGPSLWMPSSFAPTTAWLRPWGPWDEKKRRAGSFNFILSFWSATADRKVALRPRASRWQKHPCHHEIHRPEVVPSGQERNSLLTRIRDAVQGLTSRPELGVGRKGLTKLVRGLAVLVLFLEYQSQIVVRPGELRS